MLAIFLLHVTLTPHNIGELIKQKTVELVVILDRNITAKICLGFLAWIEEVLVANFNSN
jgi:hypothetical protein